MDLHVIPFKNVYNFSDPNVALSHWIDLFPDVVSKHAPLKKSNNNNNNNNNNKKAGETANPSTVAEH